MQNNIFFVGAKGETMAVINAIKRLPKPETEIKVKRVISRDDHSRLVEYGRKWLNRPNKNAVRYGHGKCSTILCELVTIAGEIPDVIGWEGNRSILIEAKTSKADFFKDKNKPWRIVAELGMGDIRYFIADKGIIPVDKLPDKWGLLEVSDGRIEVTKDAEHIGGNKNHEIIMLLSHIRRISEIKMENMEAVL